MKTYTSEQYPIERVSLGDCIVFIHEGTEYPYAVYENHLHSTGDEFNNIILKALHLSEETVHDIVEFAYGYDAVYDEYCIRFPEYHPGDYKAATRIINELFELCDDVYPKKELIEEKIDEKPTVKVKPKPKQVSFGDAITFDVKGVYYTYYVTQTHLKTGSINSIVFQKLGVEKHKYEWASMCYGYDSVEGSWPTCIYGDYVSLTRFINDIHDVCEMVNKEKDVPIEGLDVWGMITGKGKYKKAPDSQLNKVQTKKETKDGTVTKISPVTPEIIGGEKRTGHSVRSRISQTSVRIGHLSNNEISC